jgi:Holliday junction resolvasome RuvABC ATP-dependent DNA helicase subunit
MANNIKIYLQSKNTLKFTDRDWEELKDELAILPLGISRIELIVLNALKQKKECSLTHLAAKTGLTPQCLRQDFEMYLQKTDLMEITTSGRALTSKGHKYLKGLSELVKK